MPAKTVTEFIAYVKANPGKINLASGGSGTPLYVAGALFRMMAGRQNGRRHLSGRGRGDARSVGGRVQAMFGVMPASLGYLKSGKLRALAVTSDKRQELLPNVPAMSEFLPGYEAAGWYGIVAPKGTPAAIVDKLNKQVNAALADVATRKRFTDLGCNVFTGSPADFEKFIAPKPTNGRRWSSSPASRRIDLVIL